MGTIIDLAKAIKGENIIMDIMELIAETKGESGKGSKAGRSKMISGKGGSAVESEKSRVKVYNSIMDALRKTYVGQMWSTKKARRKYVTTLDTHGGSDKDQKVGNRVAKGFTGGTFKDVKGYAVRTMARHGGSKAKKFQGSKYWKSRRKST